jgi:hypothetical protein
MTMTHTTFPMDLGTYQPLALDPTCATLTDAQRATLKANIQLCRDAIVFFTATGAARGVSGHTGGPYDTVPEVMILDAFFRGAPRSLCPFLTTGIAWPPNIYWRPPRELPKKGPALS